MHPVFASKISPDASRFRVAFDVIPDDGKPLKESFAKRLLFVVLIAQLLACAGQISPQTSYAEQRCWPEFPYQDGWLGGDAAYSVPLTDTETVWLFGDSFVAASEQSDRAGSAFIHNSVAVSRCGRNGDWQIEYTWGRSSDGEPHAFLEHEGADSWWWLFDGFVHAGRLYLGLLEVEKTPPQGPLQLPFSFTGVHLGRIENPAAPPREWRVDVVALASQPTRPRMLPASTLVESGDHLYLFSFIDRSDGSYPRGLARLPLRVLDGETRDVSRSLEYLSRDGSWQAGLDAADARILMDDTATEMSVRFHPELALWIAIYNYPDVGEGFPEQRPSDTVWLRSAPRLEGPWSERQSLYHVPELSPSYAGGYDPNTGCYAAKEHPQFASGRRVTFTYVCNLFTGRDQDPMIVLQRLLVDMGLYRPIPVAVDLPLHLGDTSERRPDAGEP